MQVGKRRYRNLCTAFFHAAQNSARLQGWDNTTKENKNDDWGK